MEIAERLSGWGRGEEGLKEQVRSEPAERMSRQVQTQIHREGRSTRGWVALEPRLLLGPRKHGKYLLYILEHPARQGECGGVSTFALRGCLPSRGFARRDCIESSLGLPKTVLHEK